MAQTQCTLQLAMCNTSQYYNLRVQAQVSRLNKIWKPWAGQIIVCYKIETRIGDAFLQVREHVMTKFANERMGVKMLREKGRSGLENSPNSMESFGLNRMVEIKKRQIIGFFKGPYGKVPELPCCKVLYTCRITGDHLGCTEGENCWISSLIQACLWPTQIFRESWRFFARDVYIQGIKQVTFTTIPRAGYIIWMQVKSKKVSYLMYTCPKYSKVPTFNRSLDLVNPKPSK